MDQEQIKLKMELLAALFLLQINGVAKQANLSPEEVITGLLGAAQELAFVAPPNAREQVIEIFKAATEGLLRAYNDKTVDELNKER